MSKIIKETLLLISTVLVDECLTVQEILVLFIGRIAGTIIVKLIYPFVIDSVSLKSIPIFS